MRKIFPASSHVRSPRLQASPRHSTCVWFEAAISRDEWNVFGTDIIIPPLRVLASRPAPCQSSASFRDSPPFCTSAWTSPLQLCIELPPLLAVICALVSEFLRLIPPFTVSASISPENDRIEMPPLCADKEKVAPFGAWIMMSDAQLR